MSWRRSEWLAVLSPLITVILWIWFASAKANSWDATTAMVAEMKPEVESHSQQLAVVKDELDDIKDDVKWIRRHEK